MAVADAPAREPLLVTVDEAGKLLRISRTKAYAMAAAGELPGVIRIGHSLRVNRLKLEAWIDQASAPAAAIA
jgi:excisionase family DNA binding protein